MPEDHKETTRLIDEKFTRFHAHLINRRYIR